MSRPVTGVRADRCYSYRALESLARLVRQRLGIPLGQAIDPIQLFEDLHEIEVARGSDSVHLGYGVISLEDSEGYARYDHARDILEVLASEQTYQWLQQNHPRATYFVAHELGHCLLHTDQLVRLAQMPTQQQAAFHRGRKVHQAYEDTEWQANAFASALLMPAEGILMLEGEMGDLAVATIAERFGVSREAAGYRLELYRQRKHQLLNF